MRSVLSISVPEERKKQIMRRAKKAGMNVSAYILYALDFEENLISEDELYESLKLAEKEHAEGKTKVLGSLADLM